MCMYILQLHCQLKMYEHNAIPKCKHTMCKYKYMYKCILPVFVCRPYFVLATKVCEMEANSKLQGQ